MKPDATFTPVARRKLSDSVADQLRAMIVSGELRPGDVVPSEREMMSRMGVGRPAVREALQQLHTQGLITIAHGERSRVNQLNPAIALQQVDSIANLLIAAAPENLAHLRAARRMFEVGIVRVAAQKANALDIQRLRRLVDAQRAALMEPDAFMRADIDFHTAISDILDNPVIGAMSRAMLGWLFNHHTSLLHWSGHEEITLAEHAGIVGALEQQDAELACRRMMAHLDRSEDLDTARVPDGHEVRPGSEGIK